jgi:hypothetical protein
MKIFIKALKKAAAAAVVLVLLLVAAVFIYHQVQLKKESALIEGNGTLVEVEGQKLNVYTEGAGEDLYVFMAGSGIAAPVYEMKGLYSRFSKENRVAVMERAGYGFSDVYRDTRNLDVMLEQTRAALEKAETHRRIF